MADIFLSQDAQRLLRGKIVYLFGDSNIRALYKDIVCLLTRNKLISEADLKRRVEKSFSGDRLVYGSPLSRGRNFTEYRLYKDNNFHVEFQFITKCYNHHIEEKMDDVKDGKVKAPDIIIVNSSLWDVTRWGAHGVELFKDNLLRLMKLFRSSLPTSTLVLWVTVPPISGELFGGFLIKQVEFMKYTMRFEMMEANMFAQREVANYGYDVLDFHYHLRMLIHQRLSDGIHWKPKAMRHLTNLVLTHVALAWGVPLPGNFQGRILDHYKDPEFGGPQRSDVQLPVLPPTLDILPPPPPDGRSTSRNHTLRTLRRRGARTTQGGLLPLPRMPHQNLHPPSRISRQDLHPPPRMSREDLLPPPRMSREDLLPPPRMLPQDLAMPIPTHPVQPVYASLLLSTHNPPPYQQSTYYQQTPAWSDNNYGNLYQSFETGPQPNSNYGPVRNRTSYYNRHNPY